MVLHRVHDTVLQVVLEDDLSGVVDGVFHRRQLDQDLGAVPVLLHHFLDALQVADGPGQAVGHPLDMLRAVGVAVSAVGVGNAVGVKIVVVVDLLAHGGASFCGKPGDFPVLKGIIKENRCRRKP